MNPKYNKAELCLIIGAIGACGCALLTSLITLFVFAR